MPSIAAAAVFTFLRVTRANRTLIDAEAAAQRVEERRVRPTSFNPPAHLRADVDITADRDLGWPVYTVTPRLGEVRGALVYAHGGAWVNEIAPQHWQLVAQLAAEAHLRVSVPIYPLVPFGTAPAVVPAIADLVLAARARVGEASLAGDSAGGQIALSAAELLRDRDGVTLPHTILIAPAVDLTFTNPGIDAVQPSDPWLGRPGSRVFVEHWRGDLPVDHPLVSPLSDSLVGLGPLTVFSGTRDILNPDARLLVAKARAAGVAVSYHEAAGLPHVYPLIPGPEGRAARAAIVAELRADERRDDEVQGAATPA